MCYEKPGPRCSGHTRTNFVKAQRVLVAAEKDLSEKQAAVKVAKSLEARIALHDSTSALKAAQTKLADATKKYEASKANRAEAMDAYRVAKKEYFTSPEGINKNRAASVNPSLTEEQRAAAARMAHGGQVARDKQIEAYKSVGTAKSMLENKDDNERWDIANSRGTGPSVLDVLSRDENDAVREAVAQNENTRPEILKALSSDGKKFVRYHVADNSNTPPETLALLSEDEEWQVRYRVAKNASTPPEKLAILANDDEMFISNAAEQTADRLEAAKAVVAAK